MSKIPTIGSDPANAFRESEYFCNAVETKLEKWSSMMMAAMLSDTNLVFTDKDMEIFAERAV
jgi:hypothetical protein